MASMTINGVVSGMDWESMIDEIITAAAEPAQVQVNKKTNLQNKKSLFEEMKVMMNSLQSSLTTLKLPSTYKAKEIEIENLDGGSYKKILTATVNADAEVSVHDIEVKQIATAQTLRSRQMTGSTISSYVGGKDKVMSITAGGQTVDVEVKASDSLQSLKSRINNAIKSLDNPMNLTASVVDNKLVLKSDSTGLGQTKIEGTVRGGYSSSGVNSLKGLITNADSGATADISVTSDNYDNFKITSKGKEYKRGTDYEIINGNEIRWKQYEDTDNEIKLGKSVSDMKYTLNSNDVYSVKGTSGTTEADLSALNFIDNGTLSSRVKIVDDDGVEYTYGKDFTIEDGKVVWLDAPAETNEPATYTVNYSKTETLSSTTGDVEKSGTVIVTTEEPDTYTVTYGEGGTSQKDISVKKSSTLNDTINSYFNDLNTLYKNSATNTSNADIPTVEYTVGSRDVKYLNPADTSIFTITANGTTYNYGQDFVITNDPNSTNGWQITWGKKNANDSVAGILDKYQTEYNRVHADAPITQSNTQAAPSSETSMTLSMSYASGLTATVNASDTDKTLSTIFSGSTFDLSTFDRSKLKISGYTYGTDYTVDTSTGEIKWVETTENLTSADDDFTDTDFANFAAKYREYYGLDDDAELPTITLTDSDGVLRTYIDPADTSLFKMENMTTGEEYEYGKDYVIRVNDTGDGYVFSWAISSDKNSDSERNILDANAPVMAYIINKELTAYGVSASPEVGESYKFTFSGEVTTTDSGTVNKTDDDKSLANVLKNVTVDSDDYDDNTILSITDGTKTYVMGTDYTIDSSGNIKWLQVNESAPSSYTADYHATIGQSLTLTRSGTETAINLYSSGNGLPNFNALQAKYQEITGSSIPIKTDVYSYGSMTRCYLPMDPVNPYLTLTTDDGQTYQYGTDYIIYFDVPTTDIDASGNIPKKKYVGRFWRKGCFFSDL